ncbi:hypothetical protein [Clostridium guangxiense]|uniref:hypothetical protein n=1 Tax=Clostridium guangxiense TaxID=1662055 RepID=UPI00069EC04F|nr:hypothetical protein [Clostridium guangxiense]KOF57854.1 hypothetical protein AGR56_16760 [Clostridium sp. DMHC 10]MCD2345083.1 hypothetical protein [Clostridium guangxiense]
MKKVFSIILSVLILSTTVAVVPAKNTVSAATTSKIGSTVKVGKYTGQVIPYSKLPANVKPTTVKSLAEAEKVVDEVNNSFKSTLKKFNANAKINSSNQIKPDGTVYTMSTGTQDKVNGGPMVGTSFHVRVQYSYVSNRFSSCSNITSYLSGNTVTFSWSQQSSNYSIIDSSRTLATNVDGIITDYLITPIGLVAVSNDPESVYTEFYL